MKRRTFLHLGLGLLGAGAATALGLSYALYVEPGWLEVTFPNIGLPGLPTEAEGFSIAQISDLHLGPDVKVEHIRHAAMMTNALHPDLIALTGDFISQSARYIAPCAEELAMLRAPYGVYAVLGNHDRWVAPDRLADQLERVGIVVLRDEAKAIAIGKGRMWLIGLEDTGYTALNGGPLEQARQVWDEKALRLAELLAGIPEGEPRILLLHNPDLNELFAGMRLSLALCGHTHGGQVRLPLVGVLFVPSLFGRKYACGLVQGPASPVYVNRGVGVIAPPVRFDCRPEITFLRLHKG